MAEEDRRTEDEVAAQEAEASEATERPEENGAVENDAELEAALEEAQAKAEENWNQFLRARAELENIRRRAERDVQQARKYSIEKLAGDLLPVKDSLEMGLQAAQEEGASVASLREGSELTLKMLEQVLERFDIKLVDPVGEKFDPELHEAMAMQPSREHAPNTVIQVVQKGYALHDRLLRPAMVIVARAADEDGIDSRA
ncbi:nucleotide exchange factor GrpE [Methylonatrum kenyense]|uniref:nucleotide exchange factor GrpE n=1 Tax=Methylonatrum kenyense TaxID=455253 RepID=UPI0020C0AFAF|nr:nucleotide exchange factor GrpE [Methylonatrum kenyense]MCK8515783.1 nucleotide exchange factor GrpE [Methylonatrum kenyense]